MTVDRMKDLQKANNTTPLPAPVATNEGKKQKKKLAEDQDIELGEMNNTDVMTSQLTQRIEMLRVSIQDIGAAVPRLQAAYRRVGSALDAEQTASCQRDVDTLVNLILSRANSVRSHLMSMSQELKSNPNGSGRYATYHRLLNCHHAQITRKFVDAMAQYHRVQQDNQTRCRDQMRRQLSIVKSHNVSEEELDDILSRNDSKALMQQMFSTTSVVDAQAALSNMQQRHNELVKLEQSVLELNQLFVDMAVIIEQQGDMIDHIETQVASSAAYLGDAVVELEKAVISQKKARRKKIWLTCICFFVLLIAVLVLIWKLGLFDGATRKKDESSSM